jgi:hypothetical protein
MNSWACLLPEMNWAELAHQLIVRDFIIVFGLVYILSQKSLQCQPFVIFICERWVLTTISGFPN